MSADVNTKQLTNGLAYNSRSRADIESAADAFATNILKLQSRHEAFSLLENGKWAGTVIAEELHMLRFLLDGVR